jgi:hypothetical protein
MDTINPNRLITRDPLMLKLISGATKAAVHVDRRKAAAKKACRGRIRREDY